MRAFVIYQFYKPWGQRPSLYNHNEHRFVARSTERREPYTLELPVLPFHDPEAEWNERYHAALGKRMQS